MDNNKASAAILVIRELRPGFWEYSHKHENGAYAAWIQVQRLGYYSVSELAYDPERDVYAFDVFE